MSAITFLQIFLVCLFGAMSPGPSMVVVINNAIFKNRYHGILTSVGHGIGISIYALFAVLSVGLIIKTNLFFFNILQFLSVLFLIYLGIKSLISKSEINFNAESSNGGAKSFFQGFSISILNPKIFIWFIAIYSQFMSENNDILFNIYLVFTAGIVDAIWYCLLSFIVTSNFAINRLKNKSEILQKIVGIVFITIGLLLLLELFI